MDKVNAKLVTRSSNGLHLVVAGATHMFSLALEHEQAQVTIAAIRGVIKTVRTGQPL